MVEHRPAHLKETDVQRIINTVVYVLGFALDDTCKIAAQLNMPVHIPTSDESARKSLPIAKMTLPYTHSHITCHDYP